MQKNSKSIKFNKASFNAEWAAAKTEEEFVGYCSPRFFLQLKLTDREALLKEAYRLCCELMGVEPRGISYELLQPLKSSAPDAPSEEIPTVEDPKTDKPAPETQRKRSR